MSAIYRPLDVIALTPGSGFQADLSTLSLPPGSQSRKGELSRCTTPGLKQIFGVGEVKAVFSPPQIPGFTFVSSRNLAWGTPKVFICDFQCSHLPPAPLHWAVTLSQSAQ